MCCVIAVLCVCAIVLVLIYQYLIRKPADLSHDLVLITGAAHGIGRHLALLLSRYCQNIIVVDQNLAGLKETADLAMKQSGVSLICYDCDLSDRCAIQNLAEEIRTKHGRVTVLISNAGIVNGNYLIDIPMEKVEKLIKLIKEFLPGMLGSAYKETLDCIPPKLKVEPIEDVSRKCFLDAEPRGHIVFMSSIASQTIGTALGDYCASKAALSALSDTLRLELYTAGMCDKVVVTDIRPYAINTGMFEGYVSKLSILPILEPEYVAMQVVEAIRYRKRIVYIPKIVWFLPLVQRILPFKLLVIFYKISGILVGMNSFAHANKKQD
nr:epidermal retinal dehydrogenase 2 [Hymenolepis microstoma]